MKMRIVALATNWRKTFKGLFYISVKVCFILINVIFFLSLV